MQTDPRIEQGNGNRTGFQTLEKPRGGFPNIGKIGARFSKHWKIALAALLALLGASGWARAGEIRDLVDWTRWSEAPGLPVMRYNLGVASFNGGLYALGGADGDDQSRREVYCFNGTNWARATDLPYACADMAAAVHAGRLYIVGGRGTGSSAASFDGAIWRTEPNLPEWRYGLGAASFDGSLYAVGGREGSAQDDVFRLSGGSWQGAPALPDARDHLAVAAFNGALYAVGGADAGGPQRNVYNYSGGAGWVQVAALPEKRKDLAVAVLNDRLYAIGGKYHWGPADVSHDNVYRYDGTNWVEIACLPAVRSRHGAAALHGALYAVAGTGGRTVATNVYRYPALIARAVEPGSGSYSGGFEVAVSGVELGNGVDITSVTLCGVPVAGILSQSASQVTVRAAAATGLGGPGDVRICSLSRGLSVATNAFTYERPALIIMRPDGTHIPNESAANKADGTLFVLAHPSGLPITNTFLIANGATLTIFPDSVTTNGADAGCFRVEGLPASLTPGATQAFQIVYAGSLLSRRSQATLRIAYTGPGETQTLNLAGQAWDADPAAGPQGGGQAVTIQCAYLMGNGADITNVLLGGRTATITAQGSNWVSVITPAFAATGEVDVVAHSASLGASDFYGAYRVTPTGEIREWTDDARWTAAPSLPTARKKLTVVAYGDYLYVIGGYDDSSRDNKLNLNVYQFDGKSWWMSRSQTPYYVYSSAATVYNGGLWVLGGGETTRFKELGNKMFAYLPYIYQANLPVSRFGLGAAMLGNRMYMIGGEEIGNVRSVHDDVYYYDGSWHGAPALPGDRAYMGSVTYRGAIYSIGGTKGLVSGAQEDVYKFDGTNWATVASLPAQRSSLAAAVFDDRIYAIGGYCYGAQRDVYCYDGTNWTQIAGLPEKRADLGAAVLNGVLYAVGGQEGNTTKKDVYRYPGLVQGAVVPWSGSWTGGYPVTISGANLGNGTDITNVLLCGTAVAAILSQSASQVVVLAASGSGRRGAVTVCSRSQGATVKSNAFTYLGPGLCVLGTNNVALASGAPPDGASGTRLGRVAAGGSLALRLPLRNYGTERVYITNAIVTGPQASHFKLVSYQDFLDPDTASWWYELLLTYQPGTTQAESRAAVHLYNNGQPQPYVVSLEAASASIEPRVGPLAGGNTMTIRDVSLGNGADITNVLVGGVSATIVTQGADFVTFILPPAAMGYVGTVDLTVQSSSQGAASYTHVYTYRPAGRIGEMWQYDWLPLGPGLDNEVCALAADGAGNLFAGGYFSRAGAQACYSIARWDGAAWHAVGERMNDAVLALACGTNMVYAGGLFTAVDFVGAKRIARWDGAWWLPLGPGVGGPVYAMAYTNGKLYVGGAFTNIGAYAANNVAVWDEQTLTWSALGRGVLDTVHTLAFDASGTLYAGGDFTSVNDDLWAGHIARWDGANWTNLSQGVINGSVNALQFSQAGVLHAGGTFAAAGYSPGNSAAKFMARWDGATWTNLPQMMDYPVNALTCDDAGLMYAAKRAQRDSANPASWDGTRWAAVGDRLGDNVNALLYQAGGGALTGGLYAAGRFTYRGGAQPIYNIARARQLPGDPGVYPSSCALTGGVAIAIYGANLCNGTIGDVTLVTLCGVTAAVTAAHGSTQIVVMAGAAATPCTGDVVVVSTEYGATVRSHVFVYGSAGVPPGRSGTGILPETVMPTHRALGGSLNHRLDAGATPGWASLNLGLDDDVNALLRLSENQLIAGGSFYYADDQPARGIALWNGAAWTNLGAGIAGEVYALDFDLQQRVYAGGWFTQAGSVAANNIACWDGAAWTNLGAGLNDTVYALAGFISGPLFAAGAFTLADGRPAERVAVWTSGQWMSLAGAPLNDEVYALALGDNNELYAGGWFTNAGDVALNHVAVWNGESWTNLGAGFDREVNALAVGRDGALYAGGAFTMSGTNPVLRVARWTGTAWTNIGEGFSDEVYALGFDAGGNLHAAGQFWADGETPLRRVARWDGAAWTNLEEGLNNYAAALAFDSHGGMIAGGGFSVAGTSAAARAAGWTPNHPVIAYAMPAQGSRTGGYPVVLSGLFPEGGADISSVTLCGVPATIVNRSSSNLEVVAGASAVGLTGDMVVNTTNHGSGTRAGGFTYTAPIMALFNPFGMAIASGDPAVPENSTLFPPVPVGGAYTQAFIILNTGADPLTITDLTTNGPDSSSFVVASGAPASDGVISDGRLGHAGPGSGSSWVIPPGTSAVFDVVFAPAAFGAFNAAVGIANDASNFTMNVGGGSYMLSATSGGYQGGNSVTLFSGAPISYSNDILGLYVGGVYTTTIVAQAANWVTFIVPPADTLGPVDIVVDSFDLGQPVFAGAYTYTGPAYALRVVSPYGNPQPAMGTHTNARFTAVNCSVTSPVEHDGRTLTCLGWSLVGHDPAAGTSNSVALVVTNEATLTWLWQSDPPQQDFFVDAASAHPVAPYDSWSMAARDIQSAVDVAGEDAMVWVADGLYATGGRPAAGQAQTNRVVVGKVLTISSTDSVATVCIVGAPDVGGLNGLGPAAVRCAYLGTNAALVGVVLHSGYSGAFSGGECAGGGVLAESKAAVLNCRISGCGAYDGGGIHGGELWNSSVAGCAAENQGGGSMAASLFNATLHANQAGVAAGGAHVGAGQVAENSIMYGNTAPSNANWWVGAGVALDHCCTIPDRAGFIGTVTNHPLFVSATNLRLQVGSPCINAGAADDGMEDEEDLAGNPRVIGPAADIGAYEYPLAPSGLVAASNAVGCVQLDWSLVSGADGYAIYRSTSAVAPTNALAVVAEDASSWCDASAAPGQRYYYWLKAVYWNENSALGTAAIGWLRGTALPWLMLLLP